jgi:energy-coupling factor transport system substrate-specific component
LGNIFFFSKREFAVILAVGLISGILDGRIEMLVFAAVARTQLLMLPNFYLAHVTGGPVFGDLLESWLEYGAVLSACLVRKPAAGTIALTINGLCQVFVNGTHDPHLLYGVPGLGVDIVFALFRYKRHDLPVICLAGISCGMFWYPIVWFTHGIYLYPVSFILSDLAFRILGSAVGDGLLGVALAFLILRLVSQRKWNEPRVLVFGDGKETTKFADLTGVLVIALAGLIVVLTYSVPTISSFFLSIGPKLPGGVPQSEEYNPGYVLALLMVFLSLTLLGFWHLRSWYSPKEDGAQGSGPPSKGPTA